MPWLYTYPRIYHAIIGSEVCRHTRVTISDIESFGFEDLDITHTATACSDLATACSDDSTCDTHIIGILCYIPTEVGTSLCCFIDEVELSDGAREYLWCISSRPIIIISDDRSTRINILISEIIICIPIVVSELSEILAISLGC